MNTDYALVKLRWKMDNNELTTCWSAIKEGGLKDASGPINYVPVDVWIEMVYMEMTRRGLPV